MQTTSISTDLHRLSRKIPASFGSHDQSRFATKTRYDPATKTGLLPRDGQQSVDGLKTYVVSSTGNTSSSHQTGGKTRLSYNGVRGVPRPQSFVQAPQFDMTRDSSITLDPKERARKRAKAEATMQNMLFRDGGKTLGAKYLATNGKNKMAASVRSDSENPEANAEQQTRKRVFDVQAIRKIGWDPSSLGLDTKSKDAKQKKVHLDFLPSYIFIIQATLR